MANSPNDGAGIKTMILQARSDFEQLTGRPVDRIVGVVSDDSGWRITMEVVELERIPASTNVIGTYDVVVDRSGELLEFTRTHRYHRNRADDENGT
jgi:hypothetical protein